MKNANRLAFAANATWISCNIVDSFENVNSRKWNKYLYRSIFQWLIVKRFLEQIRSMIWKITAHRKKLINRVKQYMLCSTPRLNRQNDTAYFFTIKLLIEFYRKCTAFSMNIFIAVILQRPTLTVLCCRKENTQTVLSILVEIWL